MGVLIFDGDCGFCTSTAAWLRDRIGSGHTVQSWQQLPDLAAIGLSEADVTTASYWLDDDDQLHRGAAGIGQALRTASPFWRVLGTILVTPPISWLAKPVYALVAKNRGRMPGSTDACRIN